MPPTGPTLDQRVAVRERPSRAHVMHQGWRDLLFLHWRWDADAIQRTLPEGLYVDTFDGSAWLGIVPFYMRSIRPRFCPPVPWLSYFLEMNLRTYVHDGAGRAGVWFYSLECNQPVAVGLARTFFHLPYQHARMRAGKTAPGDIRFQSRRRGDAATSSFHYDLAPAHGMATPGTLEFFLLERYLLFSKTPQGLRVGQVHHVPYPIAEAWVSKYDTRLLALNGFAEPDRPPDHVAGSPGVQVAIYPLEA